MKGDMTERAIVPVEQKTIRFYEDEITAVRAGDGSVFVPIRPIVERLGLNWSGQYSRIRRDPVLSQVQGVCVIQTPGGRQEALSLPLDYLSGFLFGINADRVSPQYRQDVIRYQMECYKVLSEALSEGRLMTDVTFDDLLQTADPGAVQAYQIAQAVMRLARNQILLESRLGRRIEDHESRLVTLESQLGDTGRNVTPDQASQLSQAVKAVAIELGKKSSRNEFGAIYGELYRKFGITSYKMLLASRFDEAMKFLTDWHETITQAGGPF
ncbi:MAG: ORF6C domain-containing protein [Candidatus Promineofilum sp.]|nr:ORF6C domain-containing protein [Promineifilum sp.]